jgi:hypothetical protein
VVAKIGVSDKHHPNLPEKLPLLLTPLTYIHVGNATSRFDGLIPAYDLPA